MPAGDQPDWLPAVSTDADGLAAQLSSRISIRHGCEIKQKRNIRRISCSSFADELTDNPY